MCVSTRSTVEVRWQDVDAYGHVHTVAHFSMLEHARTRFFDRLFASPVTWDYAVVHLEIDFIAELLPDRSRQVICEITPTEVRSRAITTTEGIFSLDGKKVSSARCVSLPWDRDSHATRSLLAEERSALEKYMAHR